jgi:hypothetical protein
VSPLWRFTAQHVCVTMQRGLCVCVIILHVAFVQNVCRSRNE